MIQNFILNIIFSALEIDLLNQIVIVFIGVSFQDISLEVVICFVFMKFFMKVNYLKLRKKLLGFKAQ